MTDHRKTASEMVRQGMRLLFDKYDPREEDPKHLAAVEELTAKLAEAEVEIESLERIRAELGAEVKDLARDYEESMAEVGRLRAAARVTESPEQDPDGAKSGED